MDIDFYNEASAAKLGWDPSWFGCDAFDEDLADAIAKWQRKHNIASDGMCGPTTFRRVFAEREAFVHELADLPKVVRKSANNIVVNGSMVPIKWHKVVLWSEINGLRAKPGSYRNQGGKPKRDVRYFVCHWDVCLSSASCQKVLDKRGLSVYFLIDNDGTIYQTCDLQHVAFHAGSRRYNNESVGVEISNAYYPKYQKTYMKRGFGERPIVRGAEVHGTRLDPFMGFYPTQIGALTALFQALHTAFDLPYRCPMAGSRMSTTLTSLVPEGKFRGFLHHYHISRNKIDCAGLDLLPLLQRLEDET